MKKNLQNDLSKNLIFAFIAQITSFMLSLLMSMLVPKMLQSVEQFSYWQLFIFYSGYVGFLHFGLSDGIYLKYGGTDEDALDKSVIISQFRLMVIWQTVISIAGAVTVMLTDIAPERKAVWIFVFVYLLLGNATWFFGYVFQAVNKTRIYSISIMIAKLLNILSLVILLMAKTTVFLPYIVFYTLAQGAAMVYVLYCGRAFLRAKSLPLKSSAHEAASNIRIGINLTVSNIAGSLILGVGRIMIDNSEGINSFGKLSMALSLTNFFLQFITAVSMVMFPAVRKINEDTQKKLFVTIRSGISYLLCFILLMYVPLKYLLSWWLPQYTDSLYYMAFLLPVCIFDGKMQFLFNTYLKVLRMEKKMLAINLLTLLASTVMCYIGAFVIKNIIAVILAMVISVMIRNIAANICLSRSMDMTADKSLVWEISLAALFIIVNTGTDDITALVLYAAAYFIYIAVNRKEVLSLISEGKRILTKK